MSVQNEKDETDYIQGANMHVALLQESMELVALGQYHKALDYLRQYLGFAREENDEISVARAYRNIGVVYLHLKHPKKAIDFLTKGLEAARNQEPFSPQVAKALLHIGAAYEQQGQLLVAAAFYREAYEKSCAVGHQKLSGAAQLRSAGVLCKTGKYREALVSLDEAIAQATAANDDEGVVLAQKKRTETLRQQEQYVQAQRAIKLRL